MTSHILVPRLDPEQPGHLLPALLDGVLRGELGFDGVIVTDALDMAGASAATGIPEAAVRALVAGCDLLCIGSGDRRAVARGIVAAIVAAVSAGRLSPQR